MSRKSQTALEHYKIRRGQDGSGAAEAEKKSDRDAAQWKFVRIFILLILLAGVAWPLLPHPVHPLRLTYEIDLASAPEGSLVITMIAEGGLPGNLDLQFPPGVFGDLKNGVSVGTPNAHVINEDGSQGNHLIIDQTTNGWRLQTHRGERVGIIYQIDLTLIGNQETDIRRYITTPINGGVRAAGFEIFLEPIGLPVEDITVTLHNPAGLPVLVPWPALVHGGQPKDLSAPDETPAQEANLSFGEGFQPGEMAGREKPAAARNLDRAPVAASVPANLFYHPRDLADLNNALLICGDIRILTSQAHDCVIQYATDRNWYFEDQRVLSLVRNIARTEMAFFGSAPTDQITVLLAANEVKSPDGFDVYGVHTGSSVLVMIDPETTWGMLEEQAAGVVAHEMFHGWLGEAVTQVDPTTLWFTEGATTWYSSRMLVAAGIWEPDHARRLLADRLENGYAQSKVLGQLSIAEAASQVMTTSEIVRFAYAGGSAACMALDEHLSRATSQLAPLDLVLRYLYQTRDDEGLSRNSLEAAVLEVTGVDCGPWLDAYVYGTKVLPPARDGLATR